jgi:anti-sigma regulatory factor (Ser/Thr protein kinase)
VAPVESRQDQESRTMPDRAQTTPVPDAVDQVGPASLMHLVMAPGTADLMATLPGTPAAVANARRLAREALTRCPRADDLVLAVSELASNAVIHSASGQGGTFALRVRTAPRWARVEITDPGPAANRPPVARNGWGLAIVADVTDRIGATIQADGHRTAWAEVTWPCLL